MQLRERLNMAAFDSPIFRPAGRLIFKMARRKQMQAQSTATVFFRNPAQLSAFQGPLAPLIQTSCFRVLVAACSIGCEAYSLAAYLAHVFPHLDFRIDACDISKEAIAFARAGFYGPEHFPGGRTGGPTGEIEKILFLRDGEHWRVRDEIQARITFEIADVLSPRFNAYRGYDCVFGQNFMIHMNDAEAARSFPALADAVRPGGALFVGGMDLDTRPSLAAVHGLIPLDWKIAAIHDGDSMRRAAWPWHYWSLEPIDWSVKPAAPRYSTIFLKPSEDEDVRPNALAA